jgi:hypothetical protein
MNNFMNHKIIPEKKLILEYYSGNISVQDLISNKIIISKEKEYSPNYNVIHDFRDAKLLIAEKEGKHFYDFLKNEKNFYKKRRVAHLTQTPDQVATTTQFTLMVGETSVEINTFSTLKAALTWVRLSTEDYDLIGTYLNEIKINKGGKL